MNIVQLILFGGTTVAAAMGVGLMLRIAIGSPSANPDNVTTEKLLHEENHTIAIKIAAHDRFRGYDTPELQQADAALRKTLEVIQ